MYRRHRCPPLSFLACVCLLPVVVNAADESRLATKNFSAAEIEQGYSNQKVIALPTVTLGSTHDDAAEAALVAWETAQGFDTDLVFPRLGGMRVLLVPEGRNPTGVIRELESSGRYKFVEPDYLHRTQLEPSDPDFADGSQWHHRNTGQSGGIAGFDIGSIAAWDIRSDASNVVVAVIDSGARLTHRDLAPNLWTNSGEIPGNGRDDDGNGYIDDVHGIDARLSRLTAAGGDPTDKDDDGHGTHVAGIIGAAANNGVAGVGVAWNVQLMHLRFLGGTDGTGATTDGLECINYAIEHGADVINASYGSNQFSQAIIEAIEEARDAGIIFVAAAGNDGADLDLAGTYPAGYLVDNILTVGNATRSGDPSVSSNSSAGAVDLFAPGSEILSLGLTNDTESRTASGTSMAAPMVTGAIALLKAQYPADGYRDTINRLLRGVRSSPAFLGEARTGGLLHVADALATADTRPFNDDFTDRAKLAGDVVLVRASSINATTETTEPSHAGRLNRSLWFSWIAPTSGEVQIDTRNSFGDTQLAIYTGDSLAGLTEITANDNEGPGFQSARVTFEAVLDTEYQIAVDSTLPGLIVVNLAASAANDAFESAQSLSGDAPLITTNNKEASSESGEPRHFVGANGRSLWYQWTALEGQSVQVSAYSSTVDTVLAVYTGSSLNDLTLVGRNNNTGISGANYNSMVEFSAQEDTTYYLALDTLGSGEGEITLSLTNAAWQFATGDVNAGIFGEERRPRITNAPAVGPDGTVYVSSSDSYFYAINSDGTLQWRIATEGYSDSSSAAIALDGTIHFGTNLGVAYALNPDGSTRWSNSPGNSPFFTGPAIAPDGTSYYKQDEGVLRAYSPSGDEIWSYSVEGEPSYAGASIAGDGTIYYPANDGAVHALSPDGIRRWRYEPSGATGGADTSGIFTSLAIDGKGNIYGSTLTGTVFSITASGQERWIFRTPQAGENVSSSIALGDGRAYFASYGAFLYALDQTDGSQIWRTSIEAQARASSPAIAEDGSIIVGSYANKLFRFDRDGNQLRAWSAGNWFRSSPTLADGRIYIGNGDGKIYAFDLDGLGPASGDGYPWPQYRHGPRNLGRATVETIGQIVTPVPEDPGRLVNLSVRNRTSRDAAALTAGFVLQGSVTKELVVRGVGPALADFGVAGSVTETELEVYRSNNGQSVLVQRNQGWTSTSGDGSELGAFSLTADSQDSVVRSNFGSEPYTAQVLPLTTETEPGVALIEIYDASTADLRTRLTNLSARTRLTAKENVTMGFVLGGQTPRRVLLRAVGPGLDTFGVPETLDDPQLLLLKGQTAEAGNDDWNGNPVVADAAEQVGAFALLNASADAALVTSLPPGAYTAQVTAPPGQSGIVLVEVYLLPEE